MGRGRSPGSTGSPGGGGGRGGGGPGARRAAGKRFRDRRAAPHAQCGALRPPGARPGEGPGLRRPGSDMALPARRAIPALARLAEEGVGGLNARGQTSGSCDETD
ncbi:uncharacterized protein LOC128897615 [Dryobates pubescens]|uniref:uncharacterized protein LOC128897615 n=1 Tax=Dryobates pubescens TaxID=118200 RepID=UPI0023B8D001|nr:uncharacterized protein LOC128897615 [Dryobates pubescens]